MTFVCFVRTCICKCTPCHTPGFCTGFFDRGEITCQPNDKIPRGIWGHAPENI